MKKRILSILLAALMIVPMICALPITASAAVSNNYSYKFEETDVRNAVAGQVFDVAAKGESVTAPTIDGSIGTGEYAVSGTIGRNTYEGATAPVENLPVNFAVKDGYLYIAFKYPSEDVQKDIQFDIGVLQDERTDGAWSRKQVTWKRDNTTGDHSYLLKKPGTTAWQAWSNAMDSDVFLLEKAWSNGTYEAKFDLREYYEVFANSCRGEGIYETPCVSVAIWYSAGNTVGDHDGNAETPNTLKYEDQIGQTHYAYKVSNLKINSDVSTGWIPATVIIPAESLAVIAKDKRAISATVGGDYINAIAGQLLDNGRVYSDVVPTVDGTVNTSEYSASQVYTGNTYTTDGKMTLSYSVGKDGLVYVALQYKEAAHAPMLVQPGLVVNNGVVLQSRTGVTLNTNGSRGNQNSLFKDATNATGWFNHWDTLSDHWTRADASAATTHVDGLTTYEFTLSLPMMIYSLEEAGWSAYNATGIYFYFFLGSGSTQYKMSTLSGQEAAFRTKYGFGLTLGYFSPTISLPTDFYDRFKVDDFQSAEDYFALNGLDRVDVAPSHVVLDGKIGAGEYTAVQAWDKTTARAQDSQHLPGIAYDISGKNNIAYDEEYLYIGAEVYDPNFVDGETWFQLNLGALDLTDQPVDIGHFVRRMNVAFKWKDGVVTAGNYGGVLRSQECNSTKKDGGGNAYIGQSAWLAGFNTKKPEVVGSYDAETKTIVYEIKVKLADLEEAFGIENLDRIQIMTLAAYTDKNTGVKDQYAWNFFKDTTDRAMDILAIQTAVDHEYVLTYDANMYGHVLYLNRTSTTRESASIRLAAEEKNSGLRFKSHYTNEYLAEMAAYAESKGETMEIGTLIAPADYITGEFTHAALGAGNYVEVMASTATPYANANGVTTIAGSLVNIKEGNLARDFAGRGFIKIGNEYFYTDNYTVRNVSAIATDALADKSATQTDDYKYQLADGKFSPYAPGQITILEGLKSN